MKAGKSPQVASPLTFATEEEIRALVNAGPGSLCLVNMRAGSGDYRPYRKGA
ncbi:hypothetical protein MJ588_05775 [Klebsiella pneumoniae]|nr:hypothetical protein MJ588_05775 [Klebsiella pneumoniae]